MAPARLYLPRGHCTPVLLTHSATHANPAGALQGPEHAELLSPPTAPNLPAGHTVQSLDLAKLYLPAGQIAAMAFVDPATHM